MSVKGNGKGIRFIRAHVDYDGPDCLIWPLHKCNGYGTFGYLGKHHYAHRFMCELVNGPAPSPDHEAAHSCGRGDQGCIHPKHLSWKTHTDNQLDRAQHGTKNTWAKGGKLTAQQAAEIRALKGKKKQREIAAIFGISRSQVSWIMTGKSWAKPKKGYYPTQDGRFSARIKVGGKEIYLGTFDTAAEATATYNAADERFKASVSSADRS